MFSNSHQLRGFSLRLRHFEVRMFRLINNKIHCSFLDIAMRLLSFAGSAYSAVAILTILLIFSSNGKTSLFFYLFASLLTGQLFVHPVKWLVNRPRPCLALSETRVFRPLDNRNSFPSGHTCAAITTALVFSQNFPHIALPLIAIATLIGISRIYMGVHYPSDVLAGAALGCFSFFIAPHVCMPLIAYVTKQSPV